MKKSLFVLGFLLSALVSDAQVKLTIDADTHKDELSDLQYGIFFEEINHAGDGGLYAELIANRSFESYLTTAQMEQLRKNNLNPTLALGKGTGGQTVSTGNASTGSVGMIDNKMSLADAQNMALLEAQRKKYRS